jgi:hypothetical protein
MVMGEAVSSGSFVLNTSQDERPVTESPLWMQGCARCQLEVFQSGRTATRTSEEEIAATNRIFVMSGRESFGPGLNGSSQVSRRVRVDHGFSMTSIQWSSPLNPGDFSRGKR